MTIRIDTPITGYRVVKEDTAEAKDPPVASSSAEVIQMNETLERPAALQGTTYKVKTPASEHALYITINHIVLNAGTEHEHRRPFEIFVNSKNMDHFQWIVALTRIVSAVFRKGGDVTFLVEELRSVFDPRGGYFKGGRYVPSLIAEIGDIIETHLREIGLLEQAGLDEHQQRHVEAARRSFERGEGAAVVDPAEDGGFPPGASFCEKCMHKAVVQLDNCMTCLNCGESKCG
ncbi:MAG: NrdJb [Pseudomonadales bacterium]|jgi:hypothetical protein|nr:NrdJb [Pseudomonadales bacterium]